MTRPQRQEVLTWFTFLLISIGAYLLWPDLDLWIAKQFYSPSVGFTASTWPWVHAWHMSVPWVGRVILIVTALLLIFWRKTLSLTNQRKLTSLLMCMVVGLWLIMHVGFKDHWGRARPSELVEFGGLQLYSSPLIPSNACEQNCSFMSGHAATGFVLIAWGALATTRIRRRWIAIGWGLGLGLGVIRIAQGGHFLGDVIFGGLLLWACAFAYRWLYIRKRYHSRRKRLCLISFESKNT